MLLPLLPMPIATSTQKTIMLKHTIFADVSIVPRIENYDTQAQTPFIYFLMWLLAL
jgi:hypothetical protein